MPSKGIRVQISESLAAFRFNEAGVHALLQSPQGPVCRDLIKRGIRVESKAKELMRASSPWPSQPGRAPAVRTGRLWGSVTWRLGADGRSPYVDVGTAVVYAPYLEGGTSRMAKRPFLVPALQAARTAF